MVTVAVTGVSSPLGGAVVGRLDGDPNIERIIGLDHRRPEVVPPKLDVRLTGLRDPFPAALLDGANVIVNLGTVAPRGSSDRAATAARFARIVWGTRQLLAVADTIGVESFVQMSSAMAYGAHPDNPVPLTENMPLRADPAFPLGYQAMLAEELVDEFSAHHADVRTVILRPAPLLGRTEESPLLHHLQSPLLTLVSDHDPPLQFCDQTDLARAVHLAVDQSQAMRGIYNVASDGWLTAAEVSRLLGRPRVHVPEAVARVLADVLARFGLMEAGAAWVEYLMYPWIVDTSALKEHGWGATLSNRDLVRAFVEEHRDVWRIGPARLSRRRLALGAGAASAGTATVAAGVAWLLYRRWRAAR